MAGDGNGSRRVQSVDRALDLLEALVGAEGAVGVTEIARRVGLAPGTAHRLLISLAARGYVRREADRKYAVGLAAMRLGDAAYRELAVVAGGQLAALVALSGETANLAMLEGQQMVYVAQAPSPHSLRTFAEVGRRVPVHSTAVGKATLAAMPAEKVDQLIEGIDLLAATPNTVTEPARLREALRRVREEGYALDDEEHELGVRCVGVALPPVAGLRAAVSVSGPTERFTAARAGEVGARLPAMVDELAAALWPPRQGLAPRAAGAFAGRGAEAVLPD